MHLTTPPLPDGYKSGSSLSPSPKSRTLQTQTYLGHSKLYQSMGLCPNSGFTT